MDNVVLYVHKIQIKLTKDELKNVFNHYGIVYKVDLIRPFNKKLNKKEDYFDAYIHYNLWAPREKTLQLHNFSLNKLYTGKSIDLDMFPSIDWKIKKEYMDTVMRSKEVRDQFKVKVFFQKDFLKFIQNENRKLLSKYWSQYDIEKDEEEKLLDKEIELLNKIYEIESNLQLVGLVQPPEFNFIDNHFLLRLEIMSYMENRINNIISKIKDLEQRIPN
tara:strand:+ start:531 stop:1184 length:654 start_codon:yes stop_codon:yes gene_type:complete